MCTPLVKGRIGVAEGLSRCRVLSAHGPPRREDPSDTNFHIMSGQNIANHGADHPAVQSVLPLLHFHVIGQRRAVTVSGFEGGQCQSGVVRTSVGVDCAAGQIHGPEGRFHLEHVLRPEHAIWIRGLESCEQVIHRQADAECLEVVGITSVD